MLLLNFSHPLTEEHLSQIATLAGVAPEALEVRAIPTYFDPSEPFAPQVVALADACSLSPQEWQTLPILVVPPSLNVIAVALLAELHGRCGYFPPVVRLRPVPGSLPPRFEVAEILNLQALREEARARREG
ncbi:MAG: CRISPR-associated protein Csx15, partial [Anaerolineae bacterium]